MIQLLPTTDSDCTPTGPSLDVWALAGICVSPADPRMC